MPRTPLEQLRRLDSAICALEDEVGLFAIYSDTSTLAREVLALNTIWQMRDRFVCRHGLQELFTPSDSMVENWEPEPNT